MDRIDDVERICRSLARRGWLEVFQRHGMNLTAPNLKAELSRKLTIDREQSGFTDFCLDGHKGVEPGDPARSLLYHGLASPNVHPIVGRRKISNDDYPSLDELDAIENYVYSLKPFDPSKLKKLFVGVFAYEYRPAASSAHASAAREGRAGTGDAAVPTRPPRRDPEGPPPTRPPPSEPRIFVPPRAPDDPGPDASGDELEIGGLRASSAKA